MDTCIYLRAAVAQLVHERSFKDLFSAIERKRGKQVIILSNWTGKLVVVGRNLSQPHTFYIYKQSPFVADFSSVFLYTSLFVCFFKNVPNFSLFISHTLSIK